jgi:hypothetical protein
MKKKQGLEICLISNLVPKYSIKLHFIHHQNKNIVFLKIINSLIQPVDLTFTHDLIIKNLAGYTR